MQKAAATRREHDSRLQARLEEKKHKKEVRLSALSRADWCRRLRPREGNTTLDYRRVWRRRNTRKRYGCPRCRRECRTEIVDFFVESDVSGRGNGLVRLVNRQVKMSVKCSF